MDTEKIKFIIFGVVAVIIIVLLLGFFGVLPIFHSQLSTKKVDLVIWGVFDDKDIFDPIIANFRKQNKNFTIDYIKKPSQTYETDLINALAAGTGPDIFMIHNTWLPKHGDKLYPAPSTLMAVKDYQTNFVDVVSRDFILNNKIFAVPLYVDTLALFWNKDIFNSVGLAEPPKTWEDLVNLVPNLVEKTEFGEIIRPAIALGTAKNISRSTDILSLLMLQNGTKMVDLVMNATTFNKPVYINNQTVYGAQDALRFYTDFANPLKSIYTWNNQMHFSVDAFSENNLAMMINYSYSIANLMQKNPNLNFAISPMPQLKNAPKSINYADYWGLGVSLKSKNPVEAWQFLQFLSAKENLYQYLKDANRPSPRRDLISLQKNDPELSVFAAQALSATSWYQADNVAISNIFANMIESVVGGSLTYTDALKKAADQVDLLMRK